LRLSFRSSRTPHRAYITISEAQIYGGGRITNNVKDRLLAFDRDGVRTALNIALNTGIAPAEVMKELKKALGEIGDKYEKGEYFL